MVNRFFSVWFQFQQYKSEQKQFCQFQKFCCTGVQPHLMAQVWNRVTLEVRNIPTVIPQSEVQGGQSVTQPISLPQKKQRRLFLIDPRFRIKKKNNIKRCNKNQKKKDGITIIALESYAILFFSQKTVLVSDCSRLRMRKALYTFSGLLTEKSIILFRVGLRGTITASFYQHSSIRKKNMFFFFSIHIVEVGGKRLITCYLRVYYHWNKPMFHQIFSELKVVFILFISGEVCSDPC